MCSRSPRPGATPGARSFTSRRRSPIRAPRPRVPASDLAALTRLEIDGALTATQAKQVLAEIVEHGGGDAQAIAAAKGFEAMDSSALESMVDAAIAAEPDAWAKFCAGEGKALGALVGAVMKASKGQADGKAVTALLNSRRGSSFSGRCGGGFGDEPADRFETGGVVLAHQRFPGDAADDEELVLLVGGVESDLGHVAG